MFMLCDSLFISFNSQSQDNYTNRCFALYKVHKDHGKAKCKLANWHNGSLAFV